jgi:hypothetical protein
MYQNEEKGLVVQQVRFRNDAVPVIESGGEAYVVMKPVCEALDLDWEAQRQLIQRDPVLSSIACMIQAVAQDGKIRDMLSLPLAYFHGWLFRIDAARYEGDRKEKIIAYQVECYQVLYRHFFGDPRRIHLSLVEIQQKVAKLELMLSAEMPVEIFHYRENIVRLFMVFDQPGLYGPDLLHIIDGDWKANHNQAPSRMSNLGLIRDKHYIVTSIGKVASHFGFTPDYILARARLSSHVRGVTLVLAHGMHLLRQDVPDLYQWYCDTVCPAIPMTSKVYDRRQENLSLTEGALQ